MFKDTLPSVAEREGFGTSVIHAWDSLYLPSKFPEQRGDRWTDLKCVH